MKILLTGASGFLGGYLVNHLDYQGIEKFTVGRTKGNDMVCDLATEVPVLNESLFFDIVVHNAGKAHFVPRNEKENQEFFDVNVRGTKNLLESLTSLKKKPRCLVFISTVAVYGIEVGEGVDETHALLGQSPYAKSKIEAERLIQDWCELYGVNFVILRLPLVVGEKAPGNLGAMEKAIQKGYYFRLGSGRARRSMVNATDVAALIPTLIEKHGIYNLTDGMHRSFAEMDQIIAKKYNKRIKTIPVWIGQLLARIGDFIPGFPLNRYRLQKLEQSLTFNDDKAVRDLNWRK